MLQIVSMNAYNSSMYNLQAMNNFKIISQAAMPGSILTSTMRKLWN